MLLDVHYREKNLILMKKFDPLILIAIISVFLMSVAPLYIAFQKMLL